MNDENMQLEWDDVSESSSLRLLFWDELSSGSAHGSLNSLRLGQTVIANDDSQNQGLAGASGQTLTSGGGVTGGGNLNRAHNLPSQSNLWNDWQQFTNSEDTGVAHVQNFQRQSTHPTTIGGSGGVGETAIIHQGELLSLPPQDEPRDEFTQGASAPMNSTMLPQLNSVLKNASTASQLNTALLNAANASLHNGGNSTYPTSLQAGQIALPAVMNTSIPPNLPPQAHPFYLWMLQQQQNNQQEVQQTDQVQEGIQQGQNDAPRMQQQEDMLKQEAIRQQQGEAKRLQEAKEQVSANLLLPQQQASNSSLQQLNTHPNDPSNQQLQSNNNFTLQQLTNANNLTQQQLNNTTLQHLQNSNMEPQQVAMLQYQLTLAQAQQNGQAVSFSTALPSQTPMLVQPQDQGSLLQQFQLLQSLQSQGLNATSTPSISLTTGGGATALKSNQMPNQVINLVNNNPTSSKKKRKSPSPKNTTAPNQGVIGNTMKSLNNTMRSINVLTKGNNGSTPSMSPPQEKNTVSGSMKSLNSTLTCTMPPPEARSGNGVNATWDKTEEKILNPIQQGGAPAMAHSTQTSTLNNLSTSPPYQIIPAQTTGVNTTNVVSSDTDGGRALESGTDDDVMLLGSRTDHADGAVKDTNATSEATLTVTGKTNKERNREHAKNTRLRKKAYVESLKQTVDELCRERDALVTERANAAKLMAETHSKRVDVLRSFFALRAGYSLHQKRDLWSSILDESGFTCRLPVTPYQSFPSCEVQLSNCQRTISGVDAMIADVASNAVFLESLVDRYHHPMGKIKFQYTLVTEDSVTEGNQIMARWSMETLNARQCGARIELHQQGMLFCKFNSAHKIVTLDIMFDVMAFMLQVKMAMGFENFNDVAIPSTVQRCQKSFDYPMVMTLADRPYTIVQVNERWENLTGFTGVEVVGKCSCSVLQGPDTSRNELGNLMSPVLFKRTSCGMLTNYTKNRRRYKSYITLYPLSTDSTVSHYLGLTTFVQWLDPDDTLAQKSKNDKNGSGGDSSSSSSKRPRDSSLEGRTSSPVTQKSKRTKIDENMSTSYVDNDTNATGKLVVTASNRDKHSLSSLTSSMSSISATDKGNLTDGNNDLKEECNSIAVLSPARTKAATSTAPGSQKVEFSVPLSSNFPETT